MPQGAAFSVDSRSTTLRGRAIECAALDGLVEVVRAGGSRALVLRGDAGEGKSALLDYVADHASGCQVARAVGVQSEMELPFAGLHQLTAPMLDSLAGLPAPQRDALETAFGIAEGPAPNPFLVGLATLGLLSAVAERRPLLCLIDDQQWLDRASAQAFAFVARRLGADSLGLVFAARVPVEELAGLPELPVRGLQEPDARALLDSVLTAPLDRRVRDRIVAETRGNPLALVELPRGRTAAELAGGFAVPGGTDLSGTIEESFRRRLAALPTETRQLLLIAAADPTGDPALVWRAARPFHVGADAAAPAVAEGLAEFGIGVRFRHPLVRSVHYWSASPPSRQEAHLALAEATDRVADPDRRSWHMAQAASGPDEEVAEELERSAGRAQARGGLAAAAAFLERAAMLTLDASRRAERALAAAATKLQAGAFDSAMELLGIAEVGPLSELDRARVDLLQAQLAFVLNRGGDAPLLLVRAAQRLEAIDPALARETYLDAFAASTFAARSANPGGGVLDVARSAATAKPASSDSSRATDLLLAGFAANFNEGYPAGVPDLREALTAFGVAAMPPSVELRWLWLMTDAALHLWDDERWYVMSDRYLELSRETGALSEMPLALSTRAMMLLHAGDLSQAAALVEEQATVTEATGSRLAPYSAMYLAAMRGDEAEAVAMIDATTKEAPLKGEGISVACAEWTRAVLLNGLGDYRGAMAAAQQALYHQEYPELHYPGVANWAAAELIEAAARSGMLDEAASATRWISEMTQASGTNWALGVEARSRALLTQGEEAEDLFRESIRNLERTHVAAELARVRLLYGEWLRRHRRRMDAREQLRTAHEMLERMGMRGFADRARRELLATGETARSRSIPTPSELTPQEAQIARMARDGMSNPEIGSRLFISARTVQYHLRKVFAKSGISSRSQLDRVLPD